MNRPDPMQAVSNIGFALCAWPALLAMAALGVRVPRVPGPPYPQAGGTDRRDSRLMSRRS